MATSTLIVDYLGVGLASALPVAPNVPATGSAFYYETDTSTLKVWDGSAWQTVTTGSSTALTLDDLTDVTITTPSSGDVLKWNGSAWINSPPAAGGIDQLTGDVTAGPGTGSQAATLANSGVTAASYGDSTHIPTFTVDAKGRLTVAGDVAVASGAGGINELTGDVVAGPGTGSQAATLSTTGVTPAAYGTSTLIPQITVDSKGRVTALTTVGVSTAGTGGKSSGGQIALSFLPVATVATTTALAAYSYANGTLGVGATITFTANGAQTIDAHSVANGETILVKDESGGNAKYNGVYTQTQLGTGGQPAIWTRRTDFDQAAEMTAGVSISIGKASAVNWSTSWTLEANVTTVGTTAVTFGPAGAAGVAALSDPDYLTGLFDAVFGSGQNSMIYRNASVWSGITIGAAGYALLSSGGASAPVWTQLLINSHMGDVTLTALGDKDYLRWEAASSKWKNRTPTQMTADLIAFAGSTQGAVPGGSGNSASVCLLGTGAWGTLSSSSSIATDTDVTLTSVSDKDVLVYDGGTSKWLNQRARYAISAGTLGTMSDSQYIFIHRFSKAVTFPANFGAYLGHSSKAGGTVNATGSTTIDVRKAATATPTTFSSVGSITIAAGSVTPTFATSGGTTLSFAAGDVIMLRAPSPADATLSDFYATLVGYET